MCFPKVCKYEFLYYRNSDFETDSKRQDRKISPVNEEMYQTAAFAWSYPWNRRIHGSCRHPPCRLPSGYQKGCQWGPKGVPPSLQDLLLRLLPCGEDLWQKHTQTREGGKQSSCKPIKTITQVKLLKMPSVQNSKHFQWLLHRKRK